NPYMKRVVEKTYKLSLYPIANSSWLQGQIKARFGRSASLLCPGVDNEWFKPFDVPRNGERKRIVCLGKSVPWKGVADLFEALKLVRREVPHLELIMYGKEPELTAPVPNRYVYSPTD